jgi:hypothetical protein
LAASDCFRFEAGRDRQAKEAAMSLEPEEFEAGADVTNQIVGERSKGLTVAISLSAEDTDRLLTISEQTGQPVTEVARKAIQSFLKDSKGAVRTRKGTHAFDI